MRAKVFSISLAAAAAVAGVVVWISHSADAPDAAPTASPTAVVRAPATPTPAPSRAPVVTPNAPVRTTPTPTPTPTVEAAPTTGTLHITSDVPDTSVFIDRKFVGTAPVTVKDLTPGNHRLNMSATGHDGVFEDIDVKVGEHALDIKLKDVKLDEKIAVVHKHLTGSCAGTLSATPQQLRYDTTDKNDGFTVTLADIESFDIDYIAKNLKLKIRKGKTYNFTDAGGDVERLFAFHKAVDKVRLKRS